MRPTVTVPDCASMLARSCRLSNARQSRVTSCIDPRAASARHSRALHPVVVMPQVETAKVSLPLGLAGGKQDPRTCAKACGSKATHRRALGIARTDVDAAAPVCGCAQTVRRRGSSSPATAPKSSCYRRHRCARC